MIRERTYYEEEDNDEGGKEDGIHRDNAMADDAAGRDLHAPELDEEEGDYEGLIPNFGDDDDDDDGDETEEEIFHDEVNLDRNFLNNPELAAAADEAFQAFLDQEGLGGVAAPQDVVHRHVQEQFGVAQEDDLASDLPQNRVYDRDADGDGEPEPIPPPVYEVPPEYVPPPHQPQALFDDLYPQGNDPMIRHEREDVAVVDRWRGIQRSRSRRWCWNCCRSRG